MDSIDNHLMPPAGLGRMAMSSLHKCNALLHQARVESGSEQELRVFLQSVVSITTDQGTEAHLGELPDLSLSHLYHGGELEIVGSDALAIPERIRTDKLFPFTIAVPGMMHILNNLVEAVCKGLPTWMWFCNLMRPLADILHCRDSKDRLLETCIRGTDQESYQYLLERPFQKLYLGRWGSIVEVIKSVLDVEVLLIRSWDRPKYIAGTSIAGRRQIEELEADATDRDTIDRVDKAIRSSKLWATA